MSRSCWTSRFEALGYESQTDAMLGFCQEHGDAALDALAAEAGYDTSPAASERDGGAWWMWEVMGDVCVLPAGHAGPHEFTRTRDIMLEFAPAPGEGGMVGG